MKAILLILLIVFVLCEGFVSKNSNHVGSRRKRSIICSLGLTGVLKNAVLNSLDDFRKRDPLNIGDSPDGRLEDGTLYGLSRLKNLTDLEVYCVNTTLLVLSSAVGLEKAKIDFRWNYDLMFSFSGKIWVKVEEVHVEYEVRLNSTKKYNFEVTRLKLTKLEGVEVGFSGLGLLNPLVKSTMNLLYDFRRGKATEKVESLIKKALEEKLNEFASGFDLFSVVSIFF